ncbi:MAG: DoxX family protein [Hyphomicrobiales bacterium]
MSTRQEATQDTTPESSLLVKPLAPVYAAAEPYALPLLRVVTGLWFLPHGIPKIGGFAGTAEFLANTGYYPGWFWAAIVILAETVVALMLAAGFLTRLAALILFIHMLNIIAYHWGNGFLAGDGGWEYAGMWAVAILIFLVRGGGNLSVDRAIGREI